MVPQRVVRSVVRAGLRLEPYGRLSYAQEGEDLIIARFFPDHNERGCFVDVGAHHPQRFSNTYLLYLRGWRGLNIDADPALIAEFDKVRPDDINLAMGVSDESGTLTLHIFDEPALNTFDGKLAAEREATTSYRCRERKRVPVETLATILERHLPAGHTIDLLSVDAEGFDDKVLAGNDWTRFRPKCIAVEALDRSNRGRQSVGVHPFLSALGFELAAQTMNTLIYVDPSRIVRGSSSA